MLNRIKKLFQKEKPVENETISIKELQGWFNTKVSQIGLDTYLVDYFTKIQHIKTQLKEKLPILQHKEIAEKDAKQVEDRVKNIVTGHKEHYCREMERFTDNLIPLEKKWKTLSEYQEAIEFNTELDKEIDELAKRTHKSYQATQHLFFETVQDVFKSMGELNLLVKDFKITIAKYNIDKVTEIQQFITQLHAEIEKEHDLKNKIIENEKEMIEITKEVKQAQNVHKSLLESEKYKEYTNLKKQVEDIENKNKIVENNIFSFFSKLQKALKKYERIALESKPIQPYIENSVTAFWNDTELLIVEILQKLKHNLTKLNLDEKQQKNMVALIQKSETGYLNELKIKGQAVQQEKQSIMNAIKQNSIQEEIDTAKHHLNTVQETSKRIQNDVEDVKSKIEKIDINSIKQSISTKSTVVFRVTVTIQ
ncbi:hypothetical protein HOL21_02245 [Candidatus Woesearchaeota archaeon]|jgi:hypothetical protein|nr:hypothetical protein [Candidatus Woesearchaeota archaeon]MBT5397012.1 hypothetical protein [Candidatus Woesearchaeota archaeon]MBT6367442.1 hypothetical protein [Candidatus Woesearchaeota archaeon]MBT7762412.1 hypothetical protein [Candidatus Woesearchaeota archaeon]